MRSYENGAKKCFSLATKCRTALKLMIILGPMCSSCLANTLHVALHGSNQNPGTNLEPLLSIQAALNKAMPGDLIVVAPGTYAEALQTRSAGTSTAPIIVTGTALGAVIVTSSNDIVFEISHPFVVVENLIFDGQFSIFGVVRVRSNGDGLIFRNNLVRNSAKHGIDLGNGATSVSAGFDYLENVIIDSSTFKNFLAKDALGNRIDAHGIVAGGVRDLTIMRTVVEMVSGDALQVADGNWDRVSVTSAVFRNLPVTAEIAALTDFAEGVNPGENAIDTKQDSSLPVRGRLTVSQSEFQGWDGDLIGNAAALNLKEKVAVTVDACVFKDNHIALRLRGGGQTLNGANVQVSNNIFHDNHKAIRVEDNLIDFQLTHNTFGANNAQFLRLVNGGIGSGFSAMNNIFLAVSLPSNLSPVTNMALDSTQFVEVLDNDYRLADLSMAIDSATMLPAVPYDHAGNSRPQGIGADFGALEYLPTKQQVPMPVWFHVIAALAMLFAGRNVANPAGVRRFR